MSTTPTLVAAMAPRLLRWGVAALWLVHGLWILANQLQGVLPGEAAIALAEIAAAAMITKGTGGYDLLATIVSIVSGLLSALFLTKTPMVVGLAPAMALIAVLGTLVTTGICGWDAIARQRSKQQR